MFKVVKERLVWWPVKVAVPVDGGDIEEQEFEVQFRIRDVDGNRDLLSSKPSTPTDGDSTKPLSEAYAEFVEKIAGDWKEVESEGRKLPFNRANLIEVMKVPGTFMAVIEAYRACSLGEKATRKGN